MSKLADYAALVMTSMAQTPDRVCTTPEIAAASGLELPTVSKILKSLVRAGLLQSQRGPKGGYRLARQPDAISIAEIIDAIEGHPLGLTECSSALGLCSREASCAVRTNWQRISLEIRHTLEHISLAELARPPTSLATSAAIIEYPRKLREASM